LHSLRSIGRRHPATGSGCDDDEEGKTMIVINDLLPDRQAALQARGHHPRGIEWYVGQLRDFTGWIVARFVVLVTDLYVGLYHKHPIKIVMIRKSANVPGGIAIWFQTERSVSEHACVIGLV
jgi:hypothetical protein